MAFLASVESNMGNIVRMTKLTQLCIIHKQNKINEVINFHTAGKHISDDDYRQIYMSP